MNTITVFETAKQAMEALDLYASTYASGREYQQAKQQLLQTLRERARHIQNDPGAEFLFAFADALEKL